MTGVAQTWELTFTTTPLTAVGSKHTAVIKAEYPNSSWRYKAEKKNKAANERKPSNKIVRSWIKSALSSSHRAKLTYKRELLIAPDRHRQKRI